MCGRTFGGMGSQVDRARVAVAWRHAITGCHDLHGGENTHRAGLGVIVERVFTARQGLSSSASVRFSVYQVVSLLLKSWDVAVLFVIYVRMGYFVLPRFFTSSCCS